MTHSVRIAAVGVLLALAGTLAQRALAAEPAVPVAAQSAPKELPAKIQREVDTLVQALDATEFVERERAAERLGELVTDAELAPALAADFRRRLRSGATTLEVRNRLQEWLVDLPATSAAEEAPSQPLAADEIDRLIGQLGGDEFAGRVSSLDRLKSAARDPRSAILVNQRLKARLREDNVRGDERREVVALWHRSRAAWLAIDPSQWGLPEASDAQIKEWIDQVVADGEGRAAVTRRRAARRELVDALVRDDLFARVKKALEERIATLGEFTVAKTRLASLFDEARPAMAAEYWSSGRNELIQNMIVGVPQYVEGATRPSYFDRIDDETAHCKSGENLSPGDYPVGVAIAHPHQQSSAFFHLVNLPTPRARQTYRYTTLRPADERLKEISRRTLARIISEKRRLVEADMLVLGQLDAGEVSRFAGPYFDNVPDYKLPDTSARFGDQPTEHAAICYQLATIGTREAIGALERLARGRPGKQPEKAVAPMAWTAALAIARRDPPDGVDEWLLAVIDDSTPLSNDEKVTEGAEAGATAAAILLERHGATPTSFGLMPRSSDLLDRCALDGYNFLSPEYRAKVIEWWKQRRGAGA